MPNQFDIVSAHVRGFIDRLKGVGTEYIHPDKPLYVNPVSGQIAGMSAPGNTDLSKLPVVKNPDGSYSTVYSTSFNDSLPGSPTFGKEVLLRGILNGAKTDDIKALVNNYRKTGQHLGVFNNPDAATKYGIQLHEDWAGGRIPGVAMQQGELAPGKMTMPAPKALY